MVVTSGRSNRQVGAIADRLLDDLAKAGVPNLRVEGMPHCDWVLIDAGDVIVHVFRPEVRAFYNLEKMWARRARADARRADTADRRSGRPGADTLRCVCGACGSSSPPSAGSSKVPSASSRSATASARPMPAARSACDGFDIVEIKESRADDAERRMLEESIAIANIIPERAVTVILDERGESMSSGRSPDDCRAGAPRTSRRWRSSSAAPTASAPSLRDNASFAIAFGAATWPHQLVRDHAAGAALPRGHDPGRASLSPRADWRTGIRPAIVETASPVAGASAGLVLIPCQC